MRIRLPVADLEIWQSAQPFSWDGVRQFPAVAKAKSIMHLEHHFQPHSKDRRCTDTPLAGDEWHAQGSPPADRESVLLRSSDDLNVRRQLQPRCDGDIVEGFKTVLVTQ